MKRRYKVAIGSVLTLGVATLAVTSHMGLLDDNLRTVVEGKFYRSAQMDGAGFAKTIRDKKLGCVVNLRGASKEAWYSDELAACKAAGTAHVDVDLWADKPPPPKEMKKLVEALDQGPFPMLVHCKAGADRAGLASALYLIVVEKVPARKAVDEQLNWHHGHVSWVSAAAMDEFFELYFKNGNGKDFKAWVLEDYPNLYRE